MFCYVDYDCKRCSKVCDDITLNNTCPLKDTDKRVLSCESYIPILFLKEEEE